LAQQRDVPLLCNESWKMIKLENGVLVKCGQVADRLAQATRGRNK